MSEGLTPPKQRRRMSPEGMAKRAERLLIVPFRERVAELQTRLAFIAARAERDGDLAQAGSEYEKAREDIGELLMEIDTVVAGPGLGPAEDCRRALRVLMARLPG